MNSVVAQLKLTAKGMLKYGNDEDDLIAGFSRLCVSQYTMKSFPKNTNDGITPTKSTSYTNYFTPSKRRSSESLTKSSPFPGKHISRSKSLSTEKHISCSKEKHVEINDANYANYVKPGNDSELELRNINEAYRKESNENSDARLREYHAKILQFDSEHASRIEMIERNVLVKQNKEVKQLNEDQNSTSDELTYYQAMQEQRESVALQNLQQAERHRRQIEIKIKIDNDLKKEMLEKKRALANFAEPALEVLNVVTKVFISKQREKHGNSALRVLVEQVNNEHTQLSTIISHGVQGNHNLDHQLQEANEKMNTLNHLLTECKKLSEELDEKANTEQRLKEDAENKVKENMEKLVKQQQEREKQSGNAVPSDSIPPLESELSIAAAAPALLPVESMLRPMLQMFIPKVMFREYLRLSKILIDTEKLHEPLSKSTIKEKKTYKFELHKVVNTAINAISDESPRHLMDKVTRLTDLLNGKEVSHAGKRVSTKHDPVALVLCKELIAKKLVLQGPTQVASSHKAAFPIATVAISMWSVFPDVGELMLGHFYAKCPYTVPFYIPKTKEISTVDYCKLVGYSVDGTDVQSEDSFLKKLSGIVRLHAAIISSDLPPSLSNHKHPFGIEHGWAWLTRVLNLEARPATATILFDFLEVAGHALMKRYRKQFHKLLLTICQDVMPKILHVTPVESKAPVTRLKIYLENIMKTGNIKEPEGFLNRHWYGNSGYR